MNEAANIIDPSKNYWMFYSASALLNHDHEREFGSVITEAKNKLIVVDDEIIGEHVYLIPKANVDQFRTEQVYFNIPKSSLEEFEI
jgi:hypothetical protein